MPTLRLRVFVSSPDDLAAERRSAESVIASLSGTEVGGFEIVLEPMLWERDSPPIVGQKAQQAIDYYFGRASETDIYVGMLWTTLGSPVVLEDRRYGSGTIYEFEDAYARSRSDDRPKMLMYRCQRPSDVDPVKIEQVNDFFASFLGEFPAYEGNPLRFSDTEEFADRLRRDLIRVVEKISEQRLAEQALVSQQIPGRKSPEHGRTILARELAVFLRNYDDIFGEGREHDDAFPVNFMRLSTSPGENESEMVPQASSSLLNVYEAAGRRVLFVGEAGTGKTFAMLRLMQQLLDRSKDRPSAPLPVYLNLASWSPLSSRSAEGGGGLPEFLRRARYGAGVSENGIDEWVVDELVRRYSIPRRAATHLVADRQIVFCLDGLDEIGHRADESAAQPQSETAQSQSESVRKQWRRECIEAINELLKDTSVQLIVCGRRSLLDHLKTRLDVHCWLQVEPLDSTMCEAYLERWANLDGLRAALPQSPRLATSIQNPLFMRMMSMAYREMHADAIVAAAATTEFEWQTHLIDNYIRYCLSLVPSQTRGYFSSQVPRYLSWFAAHAEPDFLVEDLQPSMLFSPTTKSSPDHDAPTSEPTPLTSSAKKPPQDAAAVRSYRAYRLSSNIILSLGLALCAALPTGIAIGIEWSETVGIGESIARASTLAASAFIVTFLFSLPALASDRWWMFGGLLGTAFSVSRGITVWLSSPAANLGGTIEEGVAATVATWPVASIVFSLLGYQMFSALHAHRSRYRSKPGIQWYEVQALESLDWRWIDTRSRWRGGWLGLVIGPACGAFLWVLFGPSRGLAFGFMITLFVCMFSGFLGTGVRVSLEPNQGILRSCRHAIMTASFFTFGSVTACAVAYGTVHGFRAGVVNGVLGFSALLVLLAFGAIPVVRHICLGRVLHSQGALPTWWSWYPWTPTVQFLEDMVRYKILRRTAGGYSFRHGLIRDYFVRLWQERFARDSRH